MKHAYETVSLALGLALLGSCSGPGPSGGSSAAPAPPASSAVREGWLGRWNGPEGTFLLLERAADAATGMTWLADKANFLTVRYGEGYCRD